MNAFELNKFIGAILGALVFVMGLSVLSHIIFAQKPPETPGYTVAVEEAAPPGEETAETPAFEVLLASADAGAGEAAARVCAACHSFDAGGANGIGPALHGVVGRAMAGHEGFNYSAALRAHADVAPDWSYAELDGFLENPQGWVPGTSMGYAGIPDAEQRANVVAYLVSVSPDAPPIPEPPAEAEVAATPAADGADAAAEPAAGQVEQTFASLVASSDPADGLANAAVCAACHNYEAGQPNKLGPNLHGVFGRPIASYDGFNYSPAMTAFAGEHGEWSVDNLNSYLEAPMQVVPGTTMAYAGVKDEAQRAQIVAWLHSISPDAGPVETAAAPAVEETEVAAAPATETASPETAETAPAPDVSAEAAAAPAEAAVAPAEEAAPAQEAAPAADAAQAPAAEETAAATPAAPADTTASAAPALSTDATGVRIHEPVPGKVEIVGPTN